LKIFLFSSVAIALLTGCTPSFNSAHPYNTTYKKAPNHKALAYHDGGTVNGVKIKYSSFFTNQSTKEIAINKAILSCKEQVKRESSFDPNDCKIYDVDGKVVWDK